MNEEIMGMAIIRRSPVDDACWRGVVRLLSLIVISLTLVATILHFSWIIVM